MIDNLKYSAKAIWALFAPFIVVLINDNREWLENWVAGAVAGIISGIAVWFQKNGPKP